MHLLGCFQNRGVLVWGPYHEGSYPLWLLERVLGLIKGRLQLILVRSIWLFH